MSKATVEQRIAALKALLGAAMADIATEDEQAALKMRYKQQKPWDLAEWLKGRE